MRTRPFTAVYGVMLMLGIAGPATAQDNGARQPSAREQLQHIHTPQSIDQELARLTKDLELTPKQQQQVRPLLEEHHDRIQALLDKNPNASRQELGPQIHAISDETHHEIHALLSDHQKELEKAMQHGSIMVEKTGDLPCLRQRRQSHLLRPLDISRIRGPGSQLREQGKALIEAALQGLAVRNADCSTLAVFVTYSGTIPICSTGHGDVSSRSLSCTSGITRQCATNTASTSIELA